MRSHNGKWLSKKVDKDGYLVTMFTINGKTTTYKIHRLVALAFIPNPENKPQVNHKDGNKQNNNVDNLEWMTSGDNTRHAHINGLTKQGANHNWAKIVLDTQTGVFYETLNEAAESKNINVSTLSNYLTGKIKTNKTSLMYV